MLALRAEGGIDALDVVGARVRTCVTDGGDRFVDRSCCDLVPSAQHLTGRAVEVDGRHGQRRAHAITVHSVIVPYFCSTAWRAAASSRYSIQRVVAASDLNRA